jgi:surface protein
MRCLDEISCFLAAEFLMVWCKDGGEMDVEGCGRLVCANWVVRWREMNVSWVVVSVQVRVRWEIKGCVWSDSCHQHALHQVDTYVWGWRSVTWTCSCDSRRFTQGFWLEKWRTYLKNFCVLWSVWVFWSGFIRLFFLRVDCECNRPSFLATVFAVLNFPASAFNGDLSQWDVAKVTDMSYSKSIRILENDLTWRELMLLWLEGSVGGFGWWWWCDVKMVESWCWRMREIECTPMAHCNNVCGLWLRVIFLWDFLMIFHAFWPLRDFLMRFHAFLALVPSTVVSKQSRVWGCFQIVGCLGLFPNSRGFGVVGEEVMQRNTCGEYGRRGGWWGICWEGARVVGCAWSLSLPSLPATVFWSGFFRLLFLRDFLMPLHVFLPL